MNHEMIDAYDMQYITEVLLLSFKLLKPTF